MRWKQIENEPKAFALIFETGDEIAGVPQQFSKSQGLGGSSFKAIGALSYPKLKLPLGFKDNRLLLAAAEQASVPMPMASLMHDRFVAALAQGLENADWSAIARVTYGNAGLWRLANIYCCDARSRGAYK
jgi:hypothetical protein